MPKQCIRCRKPFIEHGAVQCGFCIPGQIMTVLCLAAAQPESHTGGDPVRAQGHALPLRRLPDHRECHPRGLALAADGRAGRAAVHPGLQA